MTDLCRSSLFLFGAATGKSELRHPRLLSATIPVKGLERLREHGRPRLRSKTGGSRLFQKEKRERGGAITLSQNNPFPEKKKGTWESLGSHPTQAASEQSKAGAM
jgi:hypothetical protein